MKNYSKNNVKGQRQTKELVFNHGLRGDFFELFDAYFNFC